MKIKAVVWTCDMWWRSSFICETLERTRLGLSITMLVSIRSIAMKDILSWLIFCFYKLVISTTYLWLTFPCFPLQKEVWRGSELALVSVDILFDQPVSRP